MNKIGIESHVTLKTPSQLNRKKEWLKKTSFRLRQKLLIF